MTRQDRADVFPNAAGGAAAERASTERTAAAPTRHGYVVADLIRELTRRERLVLMLRYTEELTVHEIAAVLEIATTEVERMLDSIAERVRRRIAPVYARPQARLA
ncbi:MAG: sigma factor-like helix-turn-helix DNA-binding protein [bacterium]